MDWGGGQYKKERGKSRHGLVGQQLLFGGLALSIVVAHGERQKAVDHSCIQLRLRLLFHLSLQ